MQLYWKRHLEEGEILFDYLINNYFNYYQIKDTNTTLFNIIVCIFEFDNEIIDEFSK
jgi:hypothetical protein